MFWASSHPTISIPLISHLSCFNYEYYEYCSANLEEEESFERLRAYNKRLYEEEQKQKS